MNFKIYKEQTVHNLQIQEAAEILLQEGKLTPPQYQQVGKTFPVDFKQANIFVRLGLLVFTFFCCAAALGLGGLLFSSFINETSGGFILILFGATLSFFNENIIDKNKWYRHGSDNGIAYFSVFCLIIGCYSLLFGFRSDEIIFSILAFIFLTVFAARYGDPILAFSAFYALIYSFLFLTDSAKLSATTTGLFMLIPSLATYILIKKTQQNSNLFYWEDCFTILEIISLIGIYAALNYYCVELFGRGETTPSVFFAFTTTLIPIVYLYFGIKNRNRILWVLGALGIAASIMTYRHYFAVMPIEWAFTLAGIVLLGLAYGLMQYLKTPRNGIVYDTKPVKSTVIESLIMNQILQQTPAPIAKSNPILGVGEFDGGGAGGEV